MSQPTPLFTEAELEVINECESESIYRRGIPFGMLFGAATYIAVKNDYIYRHPRLGTFPSVLFGAILGYSIGKLSYVGECEKRFYTMPPSQHGALYHAIIELKQGEGLLVITSGNIKKVSM